MPTIGCGIDNHHHLLCAGCIHARYWSSSFVWTKLKVPGCRKLSAVEIVLPVKKKIDATVPPAVFLSIAMYGQTVHLSDPAGVHQ